MTSYANVAVDSIIACLIAYLIHSVFQRCAISPFAKKLVVYQSLNIILSDTTEAAGLLRRILKGALYKLEIACLHDCPTQP